MVPLGPVTLTPLCSILVEGRELRVTLHTAHDGVEYVGRLFFTEGEWADDGMPYRGSIPGRTVEAVVARARDLQPDELAERWRRANAEKRRYHGLRQLTQEMLSKVRYMNQVAVSMRTGLLDAEAGQQEMELTEAQLHELVGQIKHLAGVEG